MATLITQTLLKDISVDWIKTFSKERKEPDWLVALRLEAFQAYESIPWPDMRSEQWRRTEPSVFKWDTLHFSLTPSPETQGEGWQSMEDAVRTKSDQVKQAWSEAIQKAKNNKFLLLALALGNGGVCLTVPKDKKITTPLRQISSAGGASSTCFPIKRGRGPDLG